MTKRQRIETPPRGGKWPEVVRKASLELWVLHEGSATAVRAALVERFAFTRSAPPRPSIIRWAKDAGLVDVRGPNARDTSAATKARLDRQAADRSKLSDVLLDRLTMRSAELIAERLAEEEVRGSALREAEDRLEEALLVLDALTPALGPDGRPEGTDADTRKALAELRKEARVAVSTAKLVVEARRGARIDLRDLVGVLTRTLADHLALEGIGADDGALDPGERLTIEFAVPTHPTPAEARAAIPTEEDLRARARETAKRTRSRA